MSWHWCENISVSNRTLNRLDKYFMTSRIWRKKFMEENNSIRKVRNTKKVRGSNYFSFFVVARKFSVKIRKRNWTNPNILKLSVNCRNIKKSREQRKETELVVSFLAPFFKLSPQWCSLSHLWLDQSQKVSKSLNIIHKIKFIDSSCRTRQTGLLVFFS